jgi:hypothetical protein
VFPQHAWEVSSSGCTRSAHNAPSSTKEIRQQRVRIKTHIKRSQMPEEDRNDSRGFKNASRARPSAQSSSCLRVAAAERQDEAAPTSPVTLGVAARCNQPHNILLILRVARPAPELLSPMFMSAYLNWHVSKRMSESKRDLPRHTSDNHSHHTPMCVCVWLRTD